MDSLTPLTTSSGLVRNRNNDDTPRVKILCSFNGSILPRPHDGKLRYVGGETRILSVPRDIGFNDLMARMKDLFEGASVLKYKPPDEDLDALVSVVNDDDVTNMMEEYDKLGSGDGFTRLRVFLLSNSEIDDPLHFLDTDGRDSERRYVDALNSLNDSPEFGKQPITEFQGICHVDDVQYTEQYFNHLTIPHMEPPRSPVYYSPRHPNNDFTSPPSCSYYYGPYGEPAPVTADRIYDRLPSEDYFRQHQSQLPENVPWFPPTQVSNEKASFSSNVLHGTNMFEGNNVCDHCPLPFPSSFYIRDPNDSRPFYNEVHSHVAMGPTAYPDPYVHRDDRSHYIRHRHEFGNELFHDQTIARYGNYPYGYGPSSNGHVPTNLNSNSFWKDVQSPMHGSPSNESPISPQQENGINYHLIKNPLVESPPKLAGYNGVDIPDCYPERPLKLIPNSYNLENHNTPFEPVQNTANLVGCSNPNDLVDSKALPLNTMNKKAIQNANGTESLMNKQRKDDSICLPANSFLSPENGEVKVEHLSYIPQIVESVKKKALEDGKRVKNEVQEGVDSAPDEVKEEPTHELDVVVAPEDLESDTGTESNLKIEQTKAEEEAIARGLQTIKNDDLEEIRQLGSGTYGAVYHGKWKGSDVAIKRIKASCFSGNPTERERMIADFWKEALMLSSLHHPNVVSFYGIVRDGSDGSLATVTEYMINGSLKQFLKKKDRTIDRRKRLIIAMDAAFGMEYLHGKSIVHFDLKCENLLVNMRDPHRPICKIGDLGLSKVKQQTMVSGGVRGTLPWMAPELLSGKSHMVTEKIDVYSFGVVMWELLTGDEPYTNMHCASLIGGIVNNTLRPTIPTWCDPEWKSLMESCWSGDPQERPSFLEISQKLRTMAATINVK